MESKSQNEAKQKVKSTHVSHLHSKNYPTACLLDLRKINVESADPEMQGRWGDIINPSLLKSLSTRADMLEQLAPDELNSSVWAEN